MTKRSGRESSFVRAGVTASRSLPASTLATRLSMPEIRPNFGSVSVGLLSLSASSVTETTSTLAAASPRTCLDRCRRRRRCRRCASSSPLLCSEGDSN